MTDPKKINEILLTWDISISIRDLVHSNWQRSLLDNLFYSLSCDVIPGGIGLPFRLSVDDLMELVDFILTTTYFTCKGNIYQHKKGVAMVAHSVL